MNSRVTELARYGVNGILATIVHFSVLTINLKVLNFPSAGVANMIAATVGITTSFLGSRYFVFQKTNESILVQALKFNGLYWTIATLHGLVLLLWTDWMRFDYRIGFLIATIIQVSLSYTGNKRMVFKE